MRGGNWLCNFVQIVSLISANRRRTKYRKSVTNELLESDEVEVEEGDVIVQVTNTRGGNLYEVRTPEGEFLAHLSPAMSVCTNDILSMLQICYCKLRMFRACAGETSLARLPSRFRNVVWVRRGAWILPADTLNLTMIIWLL